MLPRMMLRVLAGIAIIAVSLLAENWPQWRGPRIDGSSAETNLPFQWSETKNVAWKLPMPGLTGSTPIIWGDTIFLNTQDGENLELWSIDRNKPAVLWKRPLGPALVRVRKGNMSSPSPVTDGRTVWVLTGMGILKAFDFSGKELWSRDIQKDYGKFGLNHGYGSSPLLVDDGLIVQVLHGMHTSDPSYLLKFDLKTGKTLWRVERPTPAIRESPDSYTTPTLASVNGKKELVVTGGDVITGHDLATGKELWRGSGFNPDNDPAHRIIASPLAHEDWIVAPTRVRPMLTFRAGGRGDVSSSHRLWANNNGPDVPSPVTDGKYIWLVNDRGIWYCLDAKNGKEVWGGQRSRGGTYTSSLVMADGKLYAANEDGVVVVVKATPEKFELLAENDMNDYMISSLAVSDGQLFIRTTRHLWCIGTRRK